MPVSEYAIWSLVTVNIITLIGGFLTTYFQEKARNLAQKQDVREITNIIESVKSDLDILTHKKTSLTSEKEKFLYDYYGKYSLWLQNGLHVSILPNNDSPDIYCEKSLNKIDSLYQDFLFAEAKLYIFFHGDGEFLALANEIKLKTIALNNHVNLSLIKGKTAARRLNLAYELKAGDYQTTQIEALQAEAMAVQQEFINERNKEYAPISILHARLGITISDKIHQL